MTTELEEQFFKTFGIEPIEYRKNVPCLNFLSSGICNITDERCNPSKCNEYRPDKTSRLWRDFMEVYPKITDRKLLEMICILNSYCTRTMQCCTMLYSSSIASLKEEILKELTDILKQYTELEFLEKDRDEREEEDWIKTKIQQLFKEGE